MSDKLRPNKNTSPITPGAVRIVSPPPPDVDKPPC